MKWHWIIFLRSSPALLIRAVVIGLHCTDPFGNPFLLPFWDKTRKMEKLTIMLYTICRMFYGLVWKCFILHLSVFLYKLVQWSYLYAKCMGNLILLKRKLKQVGVPVSAILSSLDFVSHLPKATLISSGNSVSQHSVNWYHYTMCIHRCCERGFGEKVFWAESRRAGNFYICLRGT